MDDMFEEQTNKNKTYKKKRDKYNYNSLMIVIQRILNQYLYINMVYQQFACPSNPFYILVNASQ